LAANILAAEKLAWQGRGMTLMNALSLSRNPAAAFALVGMFWGTFAANIPVLKARIGADDALFGTLLLGTGVGLVLAMWLAPRFDKWLGARSIQVAALAFVAVFLLPALATGPWLFLLALTLLGIASGLTDVIMNARVSDLEAINKQSLMNANHGVFSAAYALAALASGLARQAGIDPTPIFAVLMVVALPLAIAARQGGFPEATTQRRSQGSPLATILLCGGVVLIAFMTEATVESWSALHIERTLGGGAAQGAAAPAVLGLTMAVGRFGGQIVSARFNDFTVILWGTGLSIAGVLLAAAAATPLVAYAGFALLGLGISVVGPLGLALVGRLVPAERRTEAISRVAAIGFSGFFIAPLAIGLLSDAFGLRLALASVALLLLLIVPLVGLIRRL